MARLVGWFLLALGSTLRWRVAGWRRAAALLAAGEPVVFAVWHGHGPLMLLCRRLPRVTVLVSSSRDGDRATALLTALDQDVVRGSTSAGRVGALRALLRTVNSARRPLLAVDGPRGPAGQPAAGASHVARLAGAWVVPLGAAARRGIRLNSWDRALLPLPGPAAVAVGRPVRWVDAPDSEAFSRLLADRLNRAGGRARALCGSP